MIKHRLSIGFVVLLALVFAAACGDATTTDTSPTTAEGPASSPGPESTPRPLVSDDSLSAALLTQEDLGDAWEPIDLAGATEATGSFCGEAIDFSGASALRGWSRSEPSTFLLMSVVQGNAGEAEQFIARLRAKLNTCAESVSTDGVTRTE
jgi:hypothetical protein